MLGDDALLVQHGAELGGELGELSLLDVTRGMVVQEADVQHTQQLTAVHDGHAEQRLHAPIDEDGVHDCRGVHRRQGHGLPGLRDPPGEAPPQRHPSGSTQGAPQPDGGQRLEVGARAVQHEHGAGVGAHLRAHFVEHAAQTANRLGVVMGRGRKRVRADRSRPWASSLAKHAHLLDRTLPEPYSSGVILLGR